VDNNPIKIKRATNLIKNKLKKDNNKKKRNKKGPQASKINKR